MALAWLGLGGCGGGGSDSSALTHEQSAGAPEPYEGGEASIEGFGEEAEGASRAAVLGAFHGYLGALAAREYAGACSYLAAPVTESLSQLTRAKGKPLCSKSLSLLLSPTAPRFAAQQDEGQITRVRVEDDRAFVVYRAPGAKLYELTMVKEGGAWKAAVVIGSVLVPVGVG